MHALITGVAGFIGSHLAQRCLDGGDTVIGVDAFTPYYDPAVKRANLAALAGRPGFSLRVADLREADLHELLAGVDVVYHLAGQPGVRLSWSSGFADYVGQNVLATQRLLEASRARDVRRLVYASSSSVYGNAARYPTVEDDLPRPYSPYGVTKLAAEHLCSLYAANWQVPTVSLRYFTVYGPRQRPDMAFHRFIAAALDGRPLPLFGDGEQVRDFTFVADVVTANRAAATADVPPGTVVNVAGGGSTTVNALLDELGRQLGRPVQVDHQPDQAGDVRATGGSIDAARRLLGWSPQVRLADGLAAQIAWQRDRLGQAAATP